MPPIALAAAVVAAAIAAAATSSASANPVTYHPKIDPKAFSPRLTNPYFPLTPGRTFVFTGTKDGAPERVEVKVLRGTRTIMGVRCAVISDIVTSNYTLVEKTTDWYAQNKNGDVWYFGEDTKEYKNGVVTSTAGTWEAGVDRAQPGIVMFAHPKPGPTYRQEYRPGIAEDKARVISNTTRVRVPAGTFSHVVETRDVDPLAPGKLEHKWYARGVGMIIADRRGAGHHELIKLVKAT